MRHTIVLSLPHFSLKLSKQTKEVVLTPKGLETQAHSFYMLKESESPYTDLFGKKAVRGDIPRDPFGSVTYGVKFHPYNKQWGYLEVWQYLGYSVTLRFDELLFTAPNVGTRKWLYSDISTAVLDLSSEVPKHMVVQLGEELNSDKAQLHIPVSMSFSNFPEDAIGKGERISLNNVPKHTYLQAGSFVAGVYFKKDFESMPELTYKYP